MQKEKEEGDEDDGKPLARNSLLRTCLMRGAQMIYCQMMYFCM